MVQHSEKRKEITGLIFKDMSLHSAGDLDFESVAHPLLPPKIVKFFQVWSTSYKSEKPGHEIGKFSASAYLNSLPAGGGDWGGGGCGGARSFTVFFTELVLFLNRTNQLVAYSVR